MKTYFERLNATMAIAGLLVMAPLFAWAQMTPPTHAPHSPPATKKRAATGAAGAGRRATPSEAGEPGGEHTGR